MSGQGTRQDLTGQQFDRLLIIGPSKRSDKYGNRRWECSCICGSVTLARTVDLNRGNARSCGCLRLELVRERGRQGMPVSDTPTYMTVHARIRKAKGNASEHDCTECGRQASDWAYNHQDPQEITSAGTHKGMVYSTKVECYQALCRKCHLALDAKYQAGIKAVA